MADRFITRLLAAVLAAVVLAVCMPASAGLVLDPPEGSSSKAVNPIPNATVWLCYYGGDTLGAGYKATKAAACADFFGRASQPGQLFQSRNDSTSSCTDTTTWSVNSTTFTRTRTRANRIEGAPPGFCGATVTDDYQASFYMKYAKVCPDNSTGDKADDPAACTCNAGFKANTAADACIPDCTSGKVASSGYYDVGPQAGANPKTVACAGACQVTFDGTSPAGSAIVNGEKHWFAKGSYIATGAGCTPAKQETDKVGDGVGKLPESTCKPGETAGSINGKTVCYKESGEVTEQTKNTASDSTTKTKTTNPDGSTTETEVTTRVDAKGNKEVTTKTTTTNPDGSQTVSTTVENPLPGSPLSGDGNGGTDDNKSDGEEPEKGKCEKNSSDAGCGGEAANVSDLYTAKDKTIAGIFTTARDTFLSSPIGSAAGSFFVVSSGGSCPTFQRSIPWIKADVSIDSFCTQTATQALTIFKACFLVCCAFFAFRVAVE
jgi:hypothetical protein